MLELSKNLYSQYIYKVMLVYTQLFIHINYMHICILLLFFLLQNVSSITATEVAKYPKVEKQGL